MRLVGVLMVWERERGSAVDWDELDWWDGLMRWIRAMAEKCWEGDHRGDENRERKLVGESNEIYGLKTENMVLESSVNNAEHCRIIWNSDSASIGNWVWQSTESVKQTKRTDLLNSFMAHSYWAVTSKLVLTKFLMKQQQSHQKSLSWSANYSLPCR